MRRLLWLWLGCAALWGCQQEFLPETLLTSLRVLGIRAEPAELHPGERTLLSALVLDPSREGKRSTVLWLGCEPDPFNLGRSACTDTSLLSDASALGQSDGGSPPQGVQLIGVNELAAFSTPVDLFSQLPAEDRRRAVGTVGQVLAIAVAEETSPRPTPEELEAVFTRVKNKEVASVTALFRIRVFEGAAANANPVLLPLQVDGEPLPNGGAIRLRPKQQVQLLLDAPDEAFESYELVTLESTEQKTERLIAAWYSTAGRFSEPRVALRSETLEQFTAPGSEDDPLPPGRKGELHAVVRDSRGGQSWKSWPYYVCDEALPAPLVTDVSVDGSGNLTLSGSRLTSVLEVLVGDTALLGGSANADGSAYSGRLAPLASGTHPVLVRGWNCDDLEAGSYTAP